MCQSSDHRADRRRLLATLSSAAMLAGMGLAPHAARAAAAPVDLPPPGPRDTCPVCGMFVAKYPEWIATVLWDDGEAVHFDGAKDFFKYLDDLEKYAPGRSRDQIAGMGVTEYYDLRLVDAQDALYAIGSDVLGPMGHELVPLMTEEDATDYMRDHRGMRLVGFEDVTGAMLTGLDAGRFE